MIHLLIHINNSLINWNVASDHLSSSLFFKGKSLVLYKIVKISHTQVSFSAGIRLYLGSRKRKEMFMISRNNE